MQINKSQAGFLSSVIAAWKEDNIISEEKATELENSFSIREFDWKNLAKYAFIFAIICGIIAVASVFADRKLINLFNVIIEKIFNASNLILGVLCAVISFVFFYLGQKQKHDLPDNFFTNEGFILMGSAFAAFASANFANLSGKGDAYYITTFLIATIVYCIISFIIKSQITWLLTLIALTCWICVQTASFNNWQPYLLGMNFVLRFWLFSILFLAAIILSRNQKIIRAFYSLSLYYALSLFFASLWVLSISGNTDTWETWNKTPQIHFWIWALLAIVISAAAIYYGYTKRNSLVQNFGVTFFLLNIYTRYFEYFWNGSYKSIFFIILALSFWFIGRSAEKLWNKK
ncbi:MAG: hypothetical protein PW786_12920 [Arachidicoccus sp.]|nr:hypothetical protein [Arachidicoccus sp.]